MDIVRPNKKNKLSKKILLIISLLITLTLILFLLFNKSRASYLADKDSLLIATVQRGELNISVRGTGVLAPKDIRWIATNVPARVERVLKKAGAKVKKGDLLLELSNPQLQQQLTQARWQLQALEAETRARQVALESDLLDQEIAVINEKLNFNKSQLTLDAQKELLDQGIVAISKIDYEEVKINVAQYKQRWDLEQRRLDKRRENLKAQVEANEARLSSMRKSVERIEQQVAGLQVTATMDSIVQDMPMELGQQVNAGTNLAMLARTDRFIAELRIPEKQIKDVVIGQKVTLDTRSSKIPGRVQRIDPAVLNSSVQIDVELLGPLPKEVRPELTVDGVIEITTIADTLFVKRPMFATSFSQSSVYLIDKQGGYANKHGVTFGNMSSQYIQIEQGLKEGESIIVSDSSSWQQHQQIHIN
ncbi:efflux RND transporter periplasmic adaptor subunit [Thalassomonas actiniarum]|uniref:HlyD family efflux transporter periplasmic adaptor subunit n=1 Tax=Thalassomonas actiniarum TaxID=485447 RepID=A0AAF0BYF6_9GAMM|nr:HlyD family efflux transporter periplasmic adaptor subunit [Thalassomonas actiniarum]WDD97431.1 HlyD family efflux transporter periplasmic adaptor subunit [Thalassomonas actiniarum]